MPQTKPPLWIISGLLSLLLLTGAVPPALAAGRPQPPSHLRCEYLTYPVGIDVAVPRFQWYLDHTQRGERQTAYQILVADQMETLRGERSDSFEDAHFVRVLRGFTRGSHRKESPSRAR